MKVNLPVTGVEKPFVSGSIVTKTDLKGVITYANDAFCEIAGFSREELIGHSHNMVRHPDMPPEAFADLWVTIKQGKPWRGIVKNRCKNGDHYWVEAFVVPVRKDSETVGYMSVRTPPSREQTAAAERLYAGIKKGKALPKPGLGNRLTVRQGVVALVVLMNLLLIGSGISGYLGLEHLQWALIAIGVLTSGSMGVWITGRLSGGLKAAIWTFERMAEGRLNNRIETSREDEPGQVLTALAYMQVHLKVIIDEVAAAAAVLENRTRQLEHEVEHVVARAQAQTDRVMQASSAMEEMSVSIHEVAQSAKGAAGAAGRTQEVVEKGNGQMGQSMAATSRVVRAVESSSATIAELNQSVQKIGDVTKVIKEIADQTNLLALNAAIEAARAGEQGRGFAVVADEVRKLAERTAASTADITAMVESIRDTTGVAVESMQQAAHEVEDGMTLIRASADSLRDIRVASEEVTGMAHHIADASTQQSAAGEEIASSMEQVSLLAEESMRSIREVRHATEEVARVTADLQNMVRHFDTAA